jgi:hypothetical protein
VSKATAAGLLGGWATRPCRSTVVQAGRLLIGIKTPSEQARTSSLFFKRRHIEARNGAHWANALPVGLSFGAGLETARVRVSSPARGLQGAQWHSPGQHSCSSQPGVSSFEHRVIVDTEVTLTGPFDSSTGTSSTGVTVSGAGSLKLNAVANGTH